MLSNSEYVKMANAIRALSMDAVEKANSGHPGMPMGMADVATVLFSEFLKYSPKNPDWLDRDRFVLSAGHGSMLLYSLLYLTGYEDITIDDIKNFRQLESKTAGHPEYGLLSGIETTTGPLGQGLANAVGMAIAEKMLQSRLGEDKINHYTYVIVGDGCLMEGISHEAISLAGHLKLKKLIVLFDDNKISIDGPTSLTTSDNTSLRFEAAGWNVISIDGHNFDQIRSALQEAKNSLKPTLISCNTIIGFGSPNKEGTEACHGAALGREEVEKARLKLGWNHPPFIIPEDILSSWRKVGERNNEECSNWYKHNKDSNLDYLLPQNWQEPLNKLKEFFKTNTKDISTRKASGMVLEALSTTIQNLIGGSADLTGSNVTKPKEFNVINADDFSGRYIHYGVREHAMCAIMNGLALHKNFIPYGGTFLVFTDYCRPAIRLSALMGLQVLYVMTHDSIGVGEDGPTHQPIEHLASLRAIPNLFVFRPANAIETAQCYEIAMQMPRSPSLFSLTRQDVPSLNRPLSKLASVRGFEGDSERRTAVYNEVHEDPSTESTHKSPTEVEFGKRSNEYECDAYKGAYIISPTKGKLKVTIFASGSEVSIALEAQKELHKQKIGTNVVSVPCFELFNRQSSRHKAKILNNDSIKIAIEAGIKQGWEQYIGDKGIFIGMDSFGVSAPAGELYRHFGITKENILARVSSILK